MPSHSYIPAVLLEQGNDIRIHPFVGVLPPDEIKMSIVRNCLPEHNDGGLHAIHKLLHISGVTKNIQTSMEKCGLNCYITKFIHRRYTLIVSSYIFFPTAIIELAKGIPRD